MSQNLSTSLALSLWVLAVGACHSSEAPTLEPKAKTLELEKSLSDTERERDEALEELREEQAEAAAQIKKLNDQKSDLSAAKDKAELTIVEVQGELDRNKNMTEDQRKSYEAKLNAAAQEKASLDAKIASTDTELTNAMNRIAALNQQVASLRAQIESLNAQIASLQSQLAAARAANGGSGAPAQVAAQTVYSTLNMDFNAAQCLNLVGRGSIAACNTAEARILVASGAGGEMRLAGTNLCLGLAAGQSSPQVVACDGSLSQQWNFRYRAGNSSFRIESAAFVGPNDAPVCLRNSGNQFVMDICTNPVSYFFKNNYSF